MGGTQEKMIEVKQSSFNSNFIVKLLKYVFSVKHVCTLHTPNKKGAMTSARPDRKYDAPPNECTLCDRSCR